MTTAASERIIAGLKAGVKEECSKAILLTLVSIDDTTDPPTCRLSDGTDALQGTFTSQAVSAIGAGIGALLGQQVRIDRYRMEETATGKTLVVDEFSSVVKAEPMEAENVARIKNEATDLADNSPKRVKMSNGSSSTPMSTKNRTLGALASTPGPAPSPSEYIGNRKQSQPSPGVTPSPQAGKARSRCPERRFVPIACLNPYNTQQTIKAKVMAEPYKNTFTRKDGTMQSVLKLELVDEKGSAIEGAFWGARAEELKPVLQQGRAFYFSKFLVKMADKRYTTVNNDYAITFTDSSLVEPCDDDDTLAVVEVKPEYIPMDALQKYVTRKTLVDVLGVVTDVQPLGSLRRKSDGSEVERRDITIADSSGMSVMLTLWRELAANEGAQLERLTHPIVSVLGCRTTDFRGVSLSTVNRSSVKVEPDTEAAAGLRRWWDSEGHAVSLRPAGETAQTGAVSRGPASFSYLAGLRPADGSMPSPDDKPTYHSMLCTVSMIDPDQAMYYLSAPDSKHKVVERDGRYFCEKTGKWYDHPERRYMVRMQVQDHTGVEFFNLFEDQARQLLHISADDLAGLRDGPARDTAYVAAVQAAQWTCWTARVTARSREFNGDVKMRFSIVSLQAVDWAQESQRLLRELKQMVPGGL